MNVEAFLERLRGVRREGNGWKALCPAHADKNPSLSIHVRNGRILFHCHAGCSQETVLAAMGIDTWELFATVPSPPRIVAEYEYLNEKSEMLFQVIRFEPKAFRQRRPDGNGGWQWNLTGVRRVLYGLPEVITSKSVLVCEGEKDCETARTLGLVATCNPQGAGKWKAEFAEPMRGKVVCVIADADEPGRKHAQQIAESLLGKVESLKVLQLPAAKDLSAWVEKGGKADALVELIRKTPEWKPKSQSQSTGFALIPLADLLARPDIPVEYVVENLLVAGTVSCIAAKPKVGKSTFARNLCLRVARGEDFLGLKTRQGDCIYLALEEREEDIKNDFRAMGADGSEPIQVHAAGAPAEGIAALCDLVRDRRPVLVVIDPLFRMAHIRDEKAYSETYAALGPLIDVSREVGTHVLLTHHAGKSAKADAIDSPLGSTAIGGAVSTLVLLKRNESVRTIQSVQRIGQDTPETLLQFIPETRYLSLGVLKGEAEIQGLAEVILEHLKGVADSRTEPEINDSVHGKTVLQRKALRTLVDQGKVRRDGGGKRGDPFRYSFLFSCSSYIAGTREQETENVPDTPVNLCQIVVPDTSPESVLVSVAPERERSFEEGDL